MSFSTLSTHLLICSQWLTFSSLKAYTPGDERSGRLP